MINTHVTWEVRLYPIQPAPFEDFLDYEDQPDDFVGNRFDAATLANEVAKQNEGFYARVTNANDIWDFYESDYP